MIYSSRTIGEPKFVHTATVDKELWLGGAAGEYPFPQERPADLCACRPT
jgi:hypothetical protein